MHTLTYRFITKTQRIYLFLHYVEIFNQLRSSRQTEQRPALLQDQRTRC